MDLSVEKAELDFAEGKYWCYARGTATPEYGVFCRFLRDKYRVEFCLLAHSTPAHEEYSERMIHLLNNHFGTDIIQDAAKCMMETCGVPLYLPDFLVPFHEESFQSEGL